MCPEDRRQAVSRRDGIYKAVAAGEKLGNRLVVLLRRLCAWNLIRDDEFLCTDTKPSVRGRIYSFQLRVARIACSCSACANAVRY
jgi:hypothetical protein